MNVRFIFQEDMHIFPLIHWKHKIGYEKAEYCINSNE